MQLFELSPRLCFMFVKTFHTVVLFHSTMATSNLAKFLLTLVQLLEAKIATHQKFLPLGINTRVGTNWTESRKIQTELNNFSVRFNIKILYINVPLGVTLQIIQRKLNEEEILIDRIVDVMMELLKWCLKTALSRKESGYSFKTMDRFATVALIDNIYMKWFEEYAIQKIRNHLKLWLRYVDN